jgi:hypothetical protein
MIMATISENLQILKDSTDAIKQAIIDKGGEISGDITTWASAISGLSGGSDSNENITFAGTATMGMMQMSISGSFNKTFDIAKRIVILSWDETLVIKWSTLSAETSDFSILVDFDAPVVGAQPFSMVMTDYNGANAKVVDLILL